MSEVGKPQGTPPQGTQGKGKEGEVEVQVVERVQADETFIGTKVDRRLKEQFAELARVEGVPLSQAIRELMMEAVARGYIIKERKESGTKVMKA